MEHKGRWLQDHSPTLWNKAIAQKEQETRREREEKEEEPKYIEFLLCAKNVARIFLPIVPTLEHREGNLSPEQLA